ncbi:MAG: FlgD immunoglobulin-like domain containing protein [Candidatus Eisenbacteria bacterium]
MKAHSLIAIVMLGLIAVAPAHPQFLGEGGIGITSPPDSTGASVPGRGCPDWTSTNNDFYNLYDVGAYYEWIDLDIDLLISSQFDGQQHGFVTDTEARNFLDALDLEFDNRFNWQDTDLAMTFKYAHRSEIPYDETNPIYHFLVYQDCLDDPSVPIDEINHLDVYLRPGNSASWPGPSDKKEDGPVGEPDIWHENSVGVADLGGNDLESTDEELWPRRSAQQACHEFTHICWDSNEKTYGVHYTEEYAVNPRDYWELFTCSAEYLVVPPIDSLQWDLRYGYSILDDMSEAHGGPSGFDPSCADPPASMGVNGRNYQRYHLWRLFGSYLGWRFRDPAIGETLLSRWSRNLTYRNGSWAMERTFCGLAKILDDEELYGDIGHGTPWEGPGEARTSTLFADYGIARWVDHNNYDSDYYFGSDYSPCWSAGQFMKVDSNTLAYWELAIPPEFVLDGDNVDEWTEYPDPSDANCPDGWYDYDHGAGYGHTCVPIKVDLWGSNYLVFRADTDYFTQSWDDTLVLEFDWTGNMNQDVMLWMSVLTYPTSADSLFLHGAELQVVDTEVYRPWDPQTVTITVPDFKRDHTEAVVIVLTVTDRLYDIDHDPTYRCMRRMAYTEGGPDLVFSYRFKVVGTHDPGGGCPFVASRTSSGYVEDNNVLASGVAFGSDILDAYLLAEKPENVGGEYGIQISENDTDYTQFDRIRLLAVDHSPDLDVAAFSDGSVGPYSVSALPVACRDSDGRDLLNAVLAQDGESVLIEGGSWIEVVFPAPGQSRGGGVGTRGNPSQKIDPPGGGGRDASSPGELDLTELCYRANPCTRILDTQGALSIDGDLARLRVTAPRDFYLDHIFLADRPNEPVLVRDCEVARAEHSAFGDCSGAVAADDGSYVELAPGNAIEVLFRAPQLASDHVRDFVLVTEGQYEFGRGDEDTPEPQPEEPSFSTVAYPNPFRELTTISYDVPEPGGHVIVRVYSAAGRLVRELENQPLRAGTRTLIWDGTDDRGESVASGVYFCKIQAAGREAESRLVVLK